jgi:hypothetical protein
METVEKSDDEIFDFILSYFYNKGQYQYINEDVFTGELKDKLLLWNILRLYAKLIELGFIQQKPDNKYLWQISNMGIEIMRKYKPISIILEVFKRMKVRNCAPKE